jgi:hypothetical protein
MASSLIERFWCCPRITRIRASRARTRYGRIADMLPRFDRLGGALSHDHNFQVLLSLVYADILEFHRRAYKFVRRTCKLPSCVPTISDSGSLDEFLHLHVVQIRVALWCHPE